MSLMIFSISCSKKDRDGMSDTKKDSTLIFEIDSLHLDEDTEKGYLSMNEMSPFNECTPFGSVAYKKDYNIDVFMLSSSDSAYIVMSEMFNINENGFPLWRMVDSMKIYFPVGASIGWPGSVVCNDKIDYTLMALMPEDKDWVNTEVYDNLIEVWRLNTEDKIIESVSTQNVSCINESYGVF